MSSKHRHQVFFLIAFIAICFYFSYHHIFYYSPQSTHVWRQTDCTSIALNYYYNGMDFFHPQILNVCNNEGFSVSEFPILYYITAILYQFFGVQEGILRLLSLVLVFWGLWSIYRLTYALLQDHFIAICFPLIIFSSPLLAFYSFNFLPDAAALALVFCAWYSFYQFIQSANKKYFAHFILLSLLAALLKVLALISLVALLIIWGLEKGNALNFKNHKIKFPFSRFQIIGILSIFLFVAAWLTWAKYYNEQNSAYFFAGILPFWSLDNIAQELILKKLLMKWSWVYFHPFIHLIVILAFSYFMMKPKRVHPILWWGMLLLFLANLAIYSLWFKQFNHHDYYAIALLVFPVLVLLTSFIQLQKKYPNFIKHWAFRLGLIGFTCFHIFYAKQELTFRYKADSNYKAGVNPNFYKSKTLQVWLQKNQLTYADKVLSLPDVSPNISLYYYRLRGWTNYNVKESWVPYAGRRTYTPKAIRYLIGQGCKYLLVNQKEYLQRAELLPFLDYPLDEFEGSIFLYDLRPYKK